MVREYSRCVLDKQRQQINCSISDRGTCVCLVSAIYQQGFLVSLSVQNVSLLGVCLAQELAAFTTRSFVIATGGKDAPLDLLFEASDVF